MSRDIREQSRRHVFAKALLFVFSLFLFILAITLMKDGARSLVPLVRGTLHAADPWRSLGFGWLFAYVVMSGSPVAAAALTFLDAGALDLDATFTMITGSRLGANFTVIFLGFLYVLRGRSRAASLGMGLLSFMVTATTYTAALAVGLLLLRTSWFTTIQPERGMALQSMFDWIFAPIVHVLATRLPAWGLFLSGLGLIMLSFALFDRCIPQMTIRESQVGRVSQLVYVPWVMFLLGGAVTLISMSVSVSLGILVPLSSRGFIRRENVIPYIMGANITTFIDTLLAAVLIGNPAGFTVVLAEMVSVMAVSILILATIYRPYQRAMLASMQWCTASSLNLGVFMVLILSIPILLVFV